MAEENGIREAILNIKEDIKEIFGRVHNLEIHGCAHKSAHEENYKTFWSLYIENKGKMEKQMEKLQKDIHELHISGTKVGIYVGIIVAVIGMLAQALIGFLL